MHDFLSTVSFIECFPQQSNIYDAPLSGYQNITNTSTAKQSAVFGLREFSWNLTGNYEDRGRYLEELQFVVEGVQYPESELQYPESKLQFPESELRSELQYKWRVGYRAPAATTYASDVEYSLLVSALVLPRGYMQVSSGPLNIHYIVDTLIVGTAR